MQYIYITITKCLGPSKYVYVFVRLALVHFFSFESVEDRWNWKLKTLRTHAHIRIYSAVPTIYTHLSISIIKYFCFSCQYVLTLLLLYHFSTHEMLIFCSNKIVMAKREKHSWNSEYYRLSPKFSFTKFPHSIDCRLKFKKKGIISDHELANLLARTKENMGGISRCLDY